MRGQTPSVSVVIPVRDGEAFIAEAVTSILQQTFADLELVIVDDGSTDGTRAIIDTCAQDDRRVTVITPPTPGQSSARNAGARAARAQFIAFLDADDVALPDRIERQHEFLLGHPAVAVVGGAMELIDDDGRVFDRVDCELTDAEIRAALPRWNPMAHSTVMLRKDAFDRVGGYRGAFLAAEDYDLWLRLAEHYELANLAQPVCRYRVHRRQITVVKLESQTLSGLAAVAAARARAAEGVDPLRRIDAITVDHLVELGVSREVVTADLVTNACGLASRMDCAGYQDVADELLAVAEGRARSSSGSLELVAMVHRE